jgi:methionyl-tRNA formyltransferase
VTVDPVTVDPDREALAPGLLEVTKNAVHVGTGTTPVRLNDVKAFGKKQMNAADWARGVQFPAGARFGD